MKKKYEKPMIWFEDFKMSANIAGNCGRDTGTYSDTNSCNYEFGGKYLFTGYSGCITKPQDDVDAFICYHNPSDDARLFGS